jgi:hypothetical protein
MSNEFHEFEAQTNSEGPKSNETEVLMIANLKCLCGFMRPGGFELKRT